MTFTKEQLRKKLEHRITVAAKYPDVEEAQLDADIFKLALSALAVMEAEPVIIVGDDGGDALAYRRLIQAFEPGTRLYTAPQPLTTSERAELENYRSAQQVVPGDIDARMKTAGMLSAAEIIAGQPIDAFVKHAGVVDMGSLLQWSEMRRAEFLRMQARYELGDKEKDDLYEWVISHAAVFSELHVNIRAAMQSGAVKDGWVACSERMPEEGGRYLVWITLQNSLGLSAWADSVGYHPDEIGFRFKGVITHWQPLPAAPQQEA